MGYAPARGPGATTNGGSAARRHPHLLRRVVVGVARLSGAHVGDGSTRLQELGYLQLGGRRVPRIPMGIDVVGRRRGRDVGDWWRLDTAGPAVPDLHRGSGEGVVADGRDSVEQIAITRARRSEERRVGKECR